MSRPTFESPLFHRLLWVLTKCQMEKILRFFELMSPCLHWITLGTRCETKTTRFYSLSMSIAMITSIYYIIIYHVSASKIFHITLVNLWPVFTGICWIIFNMYYSFSFRLLYILVHLSMIWECDYWNSSCSDQARMTEICRRHKSMLFSFCVHPSYSAFLITAGAPACRELSAVEPDAVLLPLIDTKTLKISLIGNHLALINYF